MNYEEIIEGAQKGLLDAVQEIERSKDVPDELREEAVNVIVTWPRDPREAVRRALELAANVGAAGAGKLILDAGAPTAADREALAEVARVEAQQIVQKAELTAEGMITAAKQMTAEAEEKARQAGELGGAVVAGEAEAEAAQIVKDAQVMARDLGNQATADGEALRKAARAEADGIVAAGNERADQVVAEAQALATEAAASITAKAEEEAEAIRSHAQVWADGWKEHEKDLRAEVKAKGEQIVTDAKAKALGIIEKAKKKAKKS